MNREAISVVIPSYNGKELLKKHLPSVLHSMQSGDELVIVDDASSDDSIQWLREQFHAITLKNTLSSKVYPTTYWPQLTAGECTQFLGQTTSPSGGKISVQIHHLKNNMRFAAAANWGVAHARNSRVFLLNNDVSPEKNVLDVVSAHFADSSVFAVGCKEYESHSKSHPSGKNALWFEHGLFQHRGMTKEELSFGDTAWASGGSSLFDRKKWLAIGGFSNRYYPAYWEDVDLSFRAKKRGWKVLFDPQAVVYHFHETTNLSEFGKRSIEATSWKHADTFTWIHATLLQKVEYLLWHPVWLWRRWQARS